MKKLLLFFFVSLLAAAQTGVPIPGVDQVYTNDGTTGTVNNELVKIGSAANTAVLLGTSDTADAILGIVDSGAGTSGPVYITKFGKVPCVFDASAAPTAGDYWTPSSTAGKCKDVGSSRPSTSYGGRVLATGSASSTQYVLLDPHAATSAGGSAPAQYIHYGSDGTAGTTGVTANTCTLYGSFMTPGAGVEFDHIAISVNTIDASNSYDFAIYDGSGNLQTHVGPSTYGVTGQLDKAIITTGSPACASSPCTLSGHTRYYWAICTSATSAVGLVLNGQSPDEVLNVNATAAASATVTSNVAPTTITMPSLTTFTAGRRMPNIILQTEP